MLRLITCLLLFCSVSACRTVEDWTVGDHKQMMRQCRVLCKGEVRGYEPITGACECRRK